MWTISKGVACVLLWFWELWPFELVICIAQKAREYFEKPLERLMAGNGSMDNLSYVKSRSKPGKYSPVRTELQERKKTLQTVSTYKDFMNCICLLVTNLGFQAHISTIVLPIILWKLCLGKM